jgi:hypothetical protein
MNTTFEDIDNKDAVEHNDIANDQSKATYGHELKSEFDTFTVPQILLKFRKAILFSLIIGCTALADGYAGIISG